METPNKSEKLEESAGALANIVEYAKQWRLLGQHFAQFQLSSREQLNLADRLYGAIVTEARSSGYEPRPIYADFAI